MKLLDFFSKKKKLTSDSLPLSSPPRPQSQARGELWPQDGDLLQRIAETSPVGIMVISPEGRITFANFQAELIFGLSKSEITRRFHNGPEWRITDFRGRPVPPEKLPFGRVLTTALPVYDIQYAVERPDGQRVFLSVNAAPLFAAEGRMDGMVAVVLDITERKRVEDRLLFVSTHDTLTGLYSRAYFEEAFSRLEQEGQFPLSVIVGDLDGLKAVNDSRGHRAGDDLLRRTGRVLQAVFRSQDVAARIGGDEFAVWLPASDQDAAQAALNRLEKALALHNGQVQGVPLRLSLGLATGKRGCSLSKILKAADQSLYAAKQGKPNHTRVLKNGWGDEKSTRRHPS